jgi:hypothetical protein
MSYIINNSRGQLLVTVPDGTINTTATNLGLIGRSVTEYGTVQNENYVYLLENFCNSIAPLQPILGQLWYNNDTDTISTYNTANAWIALASQIYVQDQKVSPAFTGIPTAPTAAVDTASTQIATTAFVINQLGGSSGNIITSGSISATGTVTGSSILGSVVIASANVIGGNILTGGLISSTGTITSAANITGSNLLTGGVISSTGNITGSVLSGSVISASTNITGGNILTGGNVSATGNVIGTNFIGNVIPPAGGAVSTTGNITGGNILTSGIVSATGNITTTNTIFADTVIANTVITTGTTSAFRLPNLTQTQINALTSQNGDMVYNTTDNLPQVYQNGVWWDFTISYYS